VINRSTRNKINTAAVDARSGYFAQEIIERNAKAPWVLMKIKGASPIAGTFYRWRYEIEEAGILAPAGAYAPFTLTNGLYNTAGNNHTPAGFALNVFELMNTAARVFPGIDPANIPAGFTLGPVEGYVRCWIGYLGRADGSGGNYAVSAHWLFEAPNPIDGECV
jgi:hypothetical protein